MLNHFLLFSIYRWVIFVKPVSPPLSSHSHISRPQMNRPEEQTLIFIGDVMLGRLVDALLPTSINRLSPESDREDSANAVDRNYLRKYPELRSYSYLSPWNDFVGLFQESGALVANLETAMTTSKTPWPDKAFNYRTHPGNIRCLTDLNMGSGRIHVSLANNHVLDYGVSGMHQTVQSVKGAGIQSAGAGRDKGEAALPGILHLGGIELRCWSFSDHPESWSSVEGFNLFNYTAAGRDFIKKQISGYRGDTSSNKPILKVVSLHWGPNFEWHPAAEIVSLAHWLIDDCGVDIIHGHSAHHTQGVEIYKNKLILYGCGDFVDDYAIDNHYRNDLSAAWRVTVEQMGDTVALKRLEVFPNRVSLFQAHRLGRDDPDHKLIVKRFRDPDLNFGTNINTELGADDQIIIEIKQ